MLAGGAREPSRVPRRKVSMGPLQEPRLVVDRHQHRQHGTPPVLELGQVSLGTNKRSRLVASPAMPTVQHILAERGRARGHSAAQEVRIQGRISSFCKGGERRGLG